MGATEKSIIDQCIKRGVPLPDRIQNAPEIYWGLEMFYMAFVDTSTCRNESDGLIPWLAIIQWCNEYDIRGELRDDVIYHVSNLDVAYLDYMSRKRKAELAKGSKKGGKGLQKAVV